MRHRTYTSLSKQGAPQGEADHELNIFFLHLRRGGSVTRHALSTLLKVCGRAQALAQGRRAHCIVIKHGFHRNIPLMTSLLDMYSNCFDLVDAQIVFREIRCRDVVATNAMITAFCRCNRPSDAVVLFSNAASRDVDTWNSLISGLVRASRDSEALRFFRKMSWAAQKPDFVTLVSVLSACGNIAALTNARLIHGFVLKLGMEAHVPIGNAIVDMYTKVGRIEDARVCFDCMGVKNVITWTTLIVGYGKHGLGKEALRAFELMKMARIVPNRITFIGVLSACSHAGLVREGLLRFKDMAEVHSILPEMVHYGCVVDLLGRAGRVDEAWRFIKGLPVEPDVEIWIGFLGSCLSHKNNVLGRLAGEKLLELRPKEAGAYVLLSNFYGRIGDLEGVARVRRLMVSNGISKVKAQTWIEIGRKIHAFESGDSSHPKHAEIKQYLEGLLERMKGAGYVPNTDVVVQDVDEKMKQEMVLGHSEKLAIGLGLISTPSGTEIMIVKNLRVCLDCHTAMKFISMVEKREIIARDSSRFHRFMDGVCSCRDHW